jgi:Lrp/AsnC family transcriptional regulator for asnA, asnC and gidA
MAEVICRDTEHFTDLVNERMHHIDGVTSTESFFVLEVHKLAYGWGVDQVEWLTLDTHTPLAPSDGQLPAEQG